MLITPTSWILLLAPREAQMRRSWPKWRRCSAPAAWSSGWSNGGISHGLGGYPLGRWMVYGWGNPKVAIPLGKIPIFHGDFSQGRWEKSWKIPIYKWMMTCLHGLENSKSWIMYEYFGNGSWTRARRWTYILKIPDVKDWRGIESSSCHGPTRPAP